MGASGDAPAAPAAPAAAAGAGAGADDKKPETHINIKVVGQDGSEVFFKMKRTMPLAKLMNSYCERRGMQKDAVRFMFDGNRIQEDSTPDNLEMEEGDAIEVMMEQTGGSVF